MSKNLVTTAIAFPAGKARRACASGVLLAGALAAFLLFASRPVAGIDANAAAQPPQHVGVFAGYDAAGLAVYRLPPVNVSVDRRAALAALDAEEAK